MASMLSMQIKCPICLEDFKNPKSLPCDHIYCQLCVQRHIQTSTGPSLCPECRHPFQSDDLKDCRLLGSVVSAARDNLRAHRAHGGMEGREEGAAGTPGVLLCREHKEGLKLFCLTDKRLVCSICRDSDRHQGHQFRPAPEAAPIFKEELTASVDFVISERIKLHNLKMKQTEEITKTKEKSRAQRARIAAHSALLVRVVQEQERAMMEQVATQEQRALDTMQRRETAIANRLAETDKLMKSLQTGLDTTRPDAFLQWWSDKGLFQVQEMKCKEAEGEGRYKSRTADLNSVPDTFSRGPYESFGPVFTWRNMLRSITDALDVLVTLDPNLKLFLEHKAVHVQRGGGGGGSGSNRGDAFAFYMPRRGEGGGFRDGYQDRALHSGRCYWEVQVG
ncbi:E3 ubiquitin-protein ligase TRIM17-like [Engraulis encrasicolus]|uniref:E3 ubiquitin-protein ligase TRIM17-like n=1 Tax=Engraulis encrasicolus TaxID=184585 RepID=UPI002FCF79FF